MRSLLALLVATVPAFAATDVQGPQSGTWTLAQSPYRLVGEVTVADGALLVVEPGVQVVAHGHFGISVTKGARLHAIGAPDQPIVFTANDPAVGWRGLRLVEADDVSTLRYCVVELGRLEGGEWFEVRGACISVVRCSPTISDNVVRWGRSHNGAFNGGGGGIYLESSDAYVARNRISRNASDGGAGICVAEYGSPWIVGNVIVGNRARYSGGGIYCAARSSPRIERNWIGGNVCTGGGGGGGISSWTGHVIFSTSPTIQSNVIVRNVAVEGGGLYSRYDRALVCGNTFSENRAERGGGIWTVNQGIGLGAPEISNCIVWKNEAQSGSQIGVEPASGSEAYVEFSTVGGGFVGHYVLDVDPLFVDPAGGDFSLAPGSPCIDAGINLSYSLPAEKDFAGNRRFVDDPLTPDTGFGGGPGGTRIVDLGAFEH